MHAASVLPDGRCKVSKDKEFQPWLNERGIEDVEALVPDMAGAARGKVLPADKLGNGELKLPEALFSQTVSGDYITDENNVEDRDMLLVPDATTLRLVVRMTGPASSDAIPLASGTPTQPETVAVWWNRLDTMSSL